MINKSIIALIILLISSISFAADHYVVSGNANNGDGTTWETAAGAGQSGAFNAIPTTLTRGDTYYIAGTATSYGGYAFDDAVDGTTLITIKKATAGAHGTETGWSASYGTTVASFSSWDVTTGYWYIDGQEGGGPGNWTSEYGFTVYNEVERAALVVLAGTVHGLTIRHSKIYSNSGDGKMHGIKGTSGSFDNIVISYCRLSEMFGVHFHMNAWTNVIVEYSYLYANKSTAEWHGELTSSIGTNSNITFRYNLIDRVDGTATFAGVNSGTSDGWKIYGNIISRSETFINYLWTGNDFNKMINSMIFNNTIVSVAGGSQGGIKIDNGANNIIYNNMWVHNISNTFAVAATHNYSYAYDNKRITAPTCLPYCDRNSNITGGEANGQIGTSEPFILYNVDPLLADFAAVTNPGFDTTDLLSENGVDMFGTVRGADGNWDRGAIEYAPPETVIPGAIIYTDVTGATRSTVYTSDNATVTGIDNVVNVTISGTGCEYSKNGAAYTSDAGTAEVDDVFSLQVTSSGSYATSVFCSITIGTESGTWGVTTVPENTTSTPSSVAGSWQ